MEGRSWLRALTPVLALSALVTLSAAPARATSCAPTTERERFASADAVVDGVFLPGDSDRHGELFSPATLRVHRWHKGPGGETLLVATLTTRLPDGSFMGSVGNPRPHAGEAWRLYGRLDEEGVLRTICLGAVRLEHLDTPLPLTGPPAVVTLGLGAAAAGAVALHWTRRRHGWLRSG